MACISCTPTFLRVSCSISWWGWGLVSMRGLLHGCYQHRAPADVAPPVPVLAWECLTGILLIRSDKEAIQETKSVASGRLCRKISTYWWAGGLALSAAFCTAVMTPLLHMRVYEPLAAVVLALLVAVLAVRALGQTDLNPVSGVGKLSQVCSGRMTGTLLTPPALYTPRAGLDTQARLRSCPGGYSTLRELTCSKLCVSSQPVSNSPLQCWRRWCLQ